MNSAGCEDRFGMQGMLSALAGGMGRRLIAAILFAGVASIAQAAERYALLVGVSEYPSLGERSQLPGSRNDVILYQRVLKERGFKTGNVTVLADGIPGAQPPTRAAIVGQFETLAKKAAKGDYVFMLFAGHGSQQPAKDLGPNNPEPDGLDETFLPRDIGKWDAPNGTVKNAIVDDEFNAMFSAIRNKGAFVWAVFTTCHSGSVTRGMDDADSRTRQVKPRDLGIPQTDMDLSAAQAAKMFGNTQSDLSQAGGALEGGVKLAPDAGGFVAFEAVQSEEEEREESQPRGHPDRQSHGRLAFVLAEVLSMNSSMSYRQAGQQLLQIYAARNYHNTTPLFEGPSLDASVFDDKIIERKRQWPIVRSASELKVDAGSLHQIGEGAIFAVMPDATAPDDKSLGYLSAGTVGVYQSTLAPAEYEGQPKMDPARIPASAFARLVNANLSIAVSVALPPVAKESAASYAKVKAALDTLSKQGIQGLRVEWKQPQEGGDIRLLVRTGQLWLMRPGAELVKTGPAKTHSIELGSKSEKEIIDVLADSLRKIGRVLNLARLGSQMSGTPVARAVEFQVDVIRDGARPASVELASVPTFRDGDELEITVRNGHNRAVDLTILAIDRDYKIDVLFPSRAGDSNRVEAKSQPFKLPRLEIEASAEAQESLLFIVTEARPLGDRADFSFLAQSELQRTRGAGAARGAGGSDLMSALESIGFEAEKTRAIKVSSATTDTTAMRLFRFNSAPKPAAPAKHHP